MDITISYWLAPCLDHPYGVILHHMSHDILVWSCDHWYHCITGVIELYSYSWADLKDHCRKYGEVTYTDAHFRTGEGRGEVCFAERDDLEKGKTSQIYFYNKNLNI